MKRILRSLGAALIVIGTAVATLHGQMQVVQPITSLGPLTTPILAADGTAAAPSIAQASDPDNGMFFGTNQVRFSTAGVERWSIDPSGNLLAFSDGVQNIGSTNANRPLAVNAGKVVFSGAVTLGSGGSAVLKLMNQGETIGVVINAATTGVAKLFALDGSSAAALQVVTGNGGVYFSDGHMVGGQATKLEWTSTTEAGTVDLRVQRIAAGQLGIQKDSTHGVTLDVGTDAVLKLFDRNGSGAANLQITGYMGTTLYGATAGALASSGLRIDQNGSVGSISQLALGYANNGSNTNAPAMIGFITTSTSSNTKGDLIFATRDVNTDTAPSERWRITSAGKLVGTGASVDALTAGVFKVFAADGSSAATLQVGGNLLLTDTGGTSTGGIIFGSDIRFYRTSSNALFIQPTAGTGVALKLGDSSTGFFQFGLDGSSVYSDSGGTRNQTFRVNSQGTNALVLNGTTGAATFVSTVIAPSFTFNGTTGKTGATCSAFTAGGCTTSPEPTVYVTDYLMPWFSGAGYHIPTISEYADLRQQIALLTSEVSALKGRDGVTVR